VNLDPEEFLNLFRGPHFDRIPGHALANIHANLATDAFVETDLHIGDYDVHAIGRIAGRVFDTVDRTKTDAGFATRAVIGNDDRDLLRLLFFFE